MQVGPLGWGLALVTALFTIVSAVVYIATGTFTREWLYASTIVYATIAVVSIAVLVLVAARREPPMPAAPPPAPVAATTGEPLLQQRTLIYATAIGEAWRLEYAWPDGRTEIRHVATANGEMMTAREIAARVDTLDVDITAYVDALPSAGGAWIDVEDVDEAIASHARHDAPSREPRTL